MMSHEAWKKMIADDCERSFRLISEEGRGIGAWIRKHAYDKLVRECKNLRNTIGETQLRLDIEKRESKKWWESYCEVSGDRRRLGDKLRILRATVEAMQEQRDRMRSRIKRLERYSGAGSAQRIYDLTKLNADLVRKIRVAVNERDDWRRKVGDLKI